MSASMLVAVEIAFNICYLVAIWGLTIAMFRRREAVPPADRKVAQRLRWMFLLLAVGDTGHVGFRVLAYALGGLEAHPLLVGLGALATAVTVTFFYALLVDTWRLRYDRKLNAFAWLLLAAGAVRLVVMVLPGNRWGAVVPPEPMGILRNLPLMLQGLGVMALILVDAVKHKDRTFLWVGIMIFVSYLFYTPVILFVTRFPLLGMLMIPKTLAYVAIAIIAYKALYSTPEVPQPEPA